MRETAERIGELEKALKESMSTAAHREALWVQEETARAQAQRQVDSSTDRRPANAHIYTQAAWHRF